MGDDDDLVRAERDVQARVGDLPIDFTARAVVSNVFRVANVVRNHMETKVLGADDLSWTAFTALFVLWVGGDQESRHLAEECGVSKGTLTGVINTLERRELVTRSGHPDDGRLVVISLTATGRQMIRRLFPRFNEDEALVVSRLAEDDRAQLAHLWREVLRSPWARRSRQAP